MLKSMFVKKGHAVPLFQKDMLIRELFVDCDEMTMYQAEDY